MTSSSAPRDPLFDDVRDVLHAATAPREAEALARIARLLDREMHDSSAAARASYAPPRRMRPARSRARIAVALVAAVLLLALASVALAKSGFVQGLFTSDTPGAQRMGAFRVSSAPTGIRNPDASAVPDDVQDRLDGLWSGHEADMARQYGKLEPRANTQTLLAGSWHGQAVAIYARATSQGKVCYTVDAGEDVVASTTCIASFFNLAEPIRIGGTVASSHAGVSGVRLYGLAADEVAAVRIHLEDGSMSEALMGTNAFYWVGAGLGSKPAEVEVEFGSGRKVTYPIEKFVGAAWGV